MDLKLDIMRLPVFLFLVQAKYMNIIQCKLLYIKSFSF